MNKERSSNIELLRILSMFFIVMSHYTVHNGVKNADLPIGFNRWFLEVSTLGNIGVIIFVLISGYFMISSSGVHISKLAKLYCQIAGYSVVIYFVFIIFGVESLSVTGLVSNIFPIMFEKYWFATAYVVLYLVSPFLNHLLNNIEQKEHLKFNIVLLFLFSIVPTFTTCQLYGNELIQFVMYYSIGGYFRKYPKSYLSNKRHLWGMMIVAVLLLYVGTLAMDFVGQKVSIFNDYSTYLFERNSVFAIFFSVTLFSIVLNIKRFYSPLINTVSACTFGVYLISDNSLMRDFLWIDLFKNAEFVSSEWLVLHAFIAVLITFIVCAIIEFIRLNTFERILKKIIYTKTDILQIKIDRIFENIFYKLNSACLKTENSRKLGLKGR